MMSSPRLISIGRRRLVLLSSAATRRAVGGGGGGRQHHRNNSRFHTSSISSRSGIISATTTARLFSSTTSDSSGTPPATLNDNNATSPPSMLRRVWKSLISDNDDHTDELKIQERKDLYYLLLVTKLRDMRLDHPDLEYREAFDKAYTELEAKNLDDMSNVQLRYEMQTLLGPQILDAFDCFDLVDKTVDPAIFQHPESNDASTIMEDHDYEPYREVLLEDYETSMSRMENLKQSPDLASTDAISIRMKRSILFLERKVGALQSILMFHGWIPPPGETSTTTTKEGGAGDWASSFPTDFDDELDDFGFRVTTADEETFIAIRRYQTINLYRAAMLRKELGYSILALKSLIPGAGRGVFVDGVAMSGSLMAFQPGPVWPLGSVRPDVEDHFADNDNVQISIRYDNFIVDSRRSPYTVLTRTNSNPFALGHVLNHPQPGALPNCQSVMLNFVEGMKLGDLYRYVPNTYAVPPAWINKTFDLYVIEMHSMCLLSRRDVQEEELYYDYRLLGTGMPHWYNKVNYPEDD